MWEWYGLIVSNCGLGVFVGGLGWYGNHEDPEWKSMPRSLWRIGDFFMCNQPMKLPAALSCCLELLAVERLCQRFWRFLEAPSGGEHQQVQIVKIHAVPNDGTRDGCVITAWISIRMLKGIGKPYPRRSQAWASTPCCFTGNGQMRGAHETKLEKELHLCNSYLKDLKVAKVATSKETKEFARSSDCSSRGEHFQVDLYKTQPVGGVFLSSCEPNQSWWTKRPFGCG